VQVVIAILVVVPPTVLVVAVEVGGGNTEHHGAVAEDGEVEAAPVPREEARRARASLHESKEAIDVASLVERVAAESADLDSTALWIEDGDADADYAVPRVLRILGTTFGLGETAAHELVNDVAVVAAKAKDSPAEIGVGDGLDVEGNDATVEHG
jgi:hypothetical protein